MSEKTTSLTMGAVLRCATVRGHGYSPISKIPKSTTVSPFPTCARNEEKSSSTGELLGVNLPTHEEPISVLRTPSQDRILAELAALQTWSGRH